MKKYKAILFDSVINGKRDVSFSSDTKESLFELLNLQYGKYAIYSWNEGKAVYDLLEIKMFAGQSKEDESKTETELLIEELV